MAAAKAPYRHPLPARLFEHKLLKVAVIGIGGTGSEIVSGLIHLHQALQSMGRPGLEVHAFDPDTVSQANLVRQRYYQADLGKNKAEVLIRRVNAALGTNWKAYPKAFNSYESWDIVLSCVDTRAARAELHRIAFREGYQSWGLWLDFGNEDRYGQVIVGETRMAEKQKLRLPCATELHPELIDLTEPEVDRPSCSAMEALEKQDLMVNKMVADLGLTLLWEGLKTGSLRYHGYYFNFENGQAQALGVPVPPKRQYTKKAAQKAA